MDVVLRSYRGEEDLPCLMELMGQELSEPYTRFTYRYFVYGQCEMSELAFDGNGSLVGAVVARCSKKSRSESLKGYIGMLAVKSEYRRRGLAKRLVRVILDRMRDNGFAECVLEAEICNEAAVSLYCKLGFVKTVYLNNYYINGSDAVRLRYFFRNPDEEPSSDEG